MDSPQNLPNYEPSDNQTHLLDLPDELLLSVLALLDPGDLATVGSVCSRLRRISKDERLWDRHELEYDFDDKPRCRRVLRAAPTLAKVTVECDENGDLLDSCDALLKSSCVVLSLVMFWDGGNEDPAFVVAVLRKHRDTLEDLDLMVFPTCFEYCDGKEHLPGSSAILDAIDAMTSLKRLKFWSHPYDKPFNFGRRPGHRHTLEWLHTAEDCTEEFVPSLVTLIDAHRLSLRSVHLIFDSRPAPPSTIQAVNSCINLEELGLDVRDWRWSVDELPTLKKLNLWPFRANMWGTVTGDTDIPQDPKPRLPVLEELNLCDFRCPSDIPRSVQDALGQLKYIGFWIQMISVRLEKSFVTDVLRRTPNLERLYLYLHRLENLRLEFFDGLQNVVPGLKMIGLSERAYHGEGLLDHLTQLWPGVKIKVLPATRFY